MQIDRSVVLASEMFSQYESPLPINDDVMLSS